MKKMIALLLDLVLLACICACAKESAEPEVTPSPAEVLEASDTDTAQSARDHVPPASPTDTDPTPGTAAVMAPAETPFAGSPEHATALNYVGQPLSALISAIGEPDQAEYAASCEMDNAEDGMLYYDGFAVWTMRTATGEIVRAVYADE